MSKRSFVPHKLVKGGFFQTILPYYYNQSPKDFSAEETVVIKFSDGDEGLLSLNGLNSDKHRPIVFLAHGLGGNSESSYKKRLSKKLVKNNFLTVRFSHRGTEGLLSQKTYHSGSFDDLKRAINYIEDRWPERKVLVVGYSLSGTIMMNMLVRSNSCEFKQVAKFVSVCSPVDLKGSSQYVQTGLKRMFDFYYSRELKKILEDRKRNNPDKIFPSLNGVYSVIGFDTVFTAKHAGYPSVDEYYADCSPIHRMNEINHPLELIFAKDDPLISEFCLQRIPRDNDCLELNIQDSGGHLGFFAANNTRFNDKRWLDEYLFGLANRIVN